MALLHTRHNVISPVRVIARPVGACALRTLAFVPSVTLPGSALPSRQVSPRVHPRGADFYAPVVLHVQRVKCRTPSALRSHDHVGEQYEHHMNNAFARDRDGAGEQALYY